MEHLAWLKANDLLDGVVIDQLEHADPLLLQRATGLGVPLIISAACRTPGSVERAMRICQDAGVECVVLQSSGGQPAPPDQVDLGLIGRLNRETSDDLAPVNAGYSNHTIGHVVAEATADTSVQIHDPVMEARQALEHGATLYKAQITLSRSWPGW